MKKIYACLAGNWVCLNDDPTCTVGNKGLSPSAWYEAGAPVFAPAKREPDKYCQLDYVDIRYKGVEYRINPIFIQVIID